jgi:guanylate kinase
MNGSGRKGNIFVFSAASGAGKTTLLDYLKSAVPNLVYSISATTRPPRPHEINGVHYFFMSETEFKQKMHNDEFAEWAVVHDHYYGTPRKFIDDSVASGMSVIMDIDVFGKKKFDRTYPDAIGIFVLPPSLDILRQRLKNRNTDSREAIDLRVGNAAKEIAFARAQGKYEYEIVNDDLEKAKVEVVAIVKKELFGIS